MLLQYNSEGSMISQSSITASKSDEYSPVIFNRTLNENCVQCKLQIRVDSAQGTNFFIDNLQAYNL